MGQPRHLNQGIVDSLDGTITDDGNPLGADGRSSYLPMEHH